MPILSENEISILSPAQNPIKKEGIPFVGIIRCKIFVEKIYFFLSANKKQEGIHRMLSCEAEANLKEIIQSRDIEDTERTDEAAPLQKNY